MRLFFAALALMMGTGASAVPASAQLAPTPKTAAGCPLEPVVFHACVAARLKTFTPPRMADGHPDFNGYWERAFTSQDIEQHGDGLGVQAGPSLVVDTPDRRIPYQPWALEVRKTVVEKFISPMASCFPPGASRQLLAPSSHQILQTPGYVVYLLEYSHSYRVIPTATVPHVPGNIKLWQGDSRGRWEGNTLVVDVTNSNGLTWFDNAGNFYSDAVRIVERFTMVDADTIHYEARIEDPKVYTRPWTIVSALTRNKEDGYELLEQACFEGNRAVEGAQSVGMKPFPGVTDVIGGGR
jgi:hypothetical protein